MDIVPSKQPSFLNKITNLFSFSAKVPAKSAIDELEALPMEPNHSSPDNTPRILNLVKVHAFPKSYSCVCGDDKEGCCGRARRWLELISKSNRTLDFQNMIKLYHDLLNCDIEEEDQLLQIRRDISRTFPKVQQFIEDQGKSALERVLLAFSRYDRSIGYV